MGYDDSCTHGGPPIERIEDLLELVGDFQNKAFQAKLFDLPPHQKSFQDEQHAADLLMLFKLVQKPEFAKLQSADVASLFMSEAVDCHQRKEAIAQAWFCAAILFSTASSSALEGDDVPQAVKEQAFEAKKDLAAVLWRWTSCNCVKAPSSHIVPWATEKAAATELVKLKNWVDAISCYEIVLSVLSKAEETESALKASSCFSSRGPRGLQQICSERARIYSNLSLCNLSSGQAEAALEASLAASKSDPRFPKAYARQVRALEALGRPAHEAAIAAVQAARTAGENAEEYLEMQERHAKEYLDTETPK